MDRHKLAAFARLGCVALTIVLVLACGPKREPAGPGPNDNANAGDQGPAKWTPEPDTQGPAKISSADAYNKQGVLKDIHFETSKWDIVPSDRKLLKENSAWLLAHPQFKVTVEGHCDERNTEAYNLALGERRANAAREYLVGLGIPAAKIQIVSYGKARPICTQQDDPCWAQNRRDHFVLVDAK